MNRVTSEDWTLSGLSLVFGLVVAFALISLLDGYKPTTPAKAWENYIEMRELADQQYREAYGLEGL